MLVKSLTVEFSEPYEGYPWSAIFLIGVNWVLLTLVAAVVIARRPWQKGVLEQAPENE